MEMNASALRNQLLFFKPFITGCSLESARKGQDKLGELMKRPRLEKLRLKEHRFENFSGCWVLPKDTRRQGVVLYLHGGGYVSGSLEYAQGFGAVLSDEMGVRVFCCAYRLAPEAPFPAAVEDALEAYRYLLSKGYNKITLCGESAGGGLCYALALKLKQSHLPMPCGIIAISPWVDLRCEGQYYEENKEKDPTLTQALLKYYAGCYSDDTENPLVSPLLGDLQGLPPSLIFAGSEELLLSDAQNLHNALKKAGCSSQFFIGQGLWHGYLLYPLQEVQKEFSRMGHFLNCHMARENKLRWVKLDNAAKIYPAARRHNWSNVFRLSATLTEPVDVSVLQSALDITARRFPTIAARLRKGVFWYYLQQLEHAPPISEEYSYPLARMNSREARQCAFRVIAWENRIAVEFFHSLTDGTGGLVFLKTLVAEYLQQKHDILIPAEQGVLGRLEEPSPQEMEDSFLRYAGTVSASRKESTAWRFRGTPETGDRLHVTCFRLCAPQVVEKAHEHGLTLTGLLTAAMLQALLQLQEKNEPNLRRRKPVKVLVPVNLRKIFPSNTLRNFAMYTIPEIDPRLGHYSFREICQIVYHKMKLDVTPKQMSKMIATNVSSELLLPVRLLPLPVKNLVMKAIFDAVGEKKSCLSLSNLGNVELPDAMRPYIERFDMILGTQATAPYNCGVLSWNDTLYMNFIRNITQSDLELQFFRVLQSLGLSVSVESNGA